MKDKNHYDTHKYLVQYGYYNPNQRDEKQFDPEHEKIFRRRRLFELDRKHLKDEMVSKIQDKKFQNYDELWSKLDK